MGLIRNHRWYLEATGEVLSKKLKTKLLSEFSDQTTEVLEIHGYLNRIKQPTGQGGLGSVLVGGADASKEKQCSFGSWSSKESWRVTEACWGNAAEKEAPWPQLWDRVIPSEDWTISLWTISHHQSPS